MNLVYYHFVTEQAKCYNMSPILTFDQPLYWKGIEIQLSEDDINVLKKIVFRLGGLHTTMSFLGSIGHIMTSSELQAMLETVCAENTVPYMLNGKAICRAVHGHLLVVSALHAIIMSEIYSCPVILENDEEEKQPLEVFDIDDNVDLLQISKLFEKSISGEINAEDVEQSEVIKTMIEQVEAYKNILASSRTATLWFKYKWWKFYVNLLRLSDQGTTIFICKQSMICYLTLQHRDTLYMLSQAMFIFKQCQS